MRLYPGYWNGVSGFLDDDRSIEEKVRAELGEELGIKKSAVKKISRGPVFDQEALKYKKTWIVHPILVEVKNKNVTLDWEAQKYQWLTLAAALKLPLLPGFDQVLAALFPPPRLK